MNIDWEPPQARAGLVGSWDKFVGPGATNAEELLQIGFGAIIAAALIALFWLSGTAELSVWHWVFVVVLALDIGGGIVTNATSAAKRWYHRKGHGHGKHFMFVCAPSVASGPCRVVVCAEPNVLLRGFGGGLVAGHCVDLGGAALSSASNSIWSRRVVHFAVLLVGNGIAAS